MFYIYVKCHFDAAHKLDLPYDSPCRNLHGHRFLVEVEIRSKTLNDQGLVVDFKHIKSIVNKLDHSCLNDTLVQPTAERIAKYIFTEIQTETGFVPEFVRIWESDNSYAEYRSDE